MHCIIWPHFPKKHEIEKKKSVWGRAQKIPCKYIIELRRKKTFCATKNMILNLEPDCIEIEKKKKKQLAKRYAQ